MLVQLLSNFIPVATKDVETRIIRMVKEAYENVPFYRTVMDDQGLKPAAFKVLSDFVEKFPRTSAREYRRIMKERGDSFVMDRRFANEPFKKLLSGGSSGIPVNILRTNSEYRQIDGANTVYAFILGGIRPWHKIMAMFPPWDIKERHHFLQNLGIFRRYDASFLEDADTILNRISEKGVNVLFGCVSMMRMLADSCVRFSSHGCTVKSTARPRPGSLPSGRATGTIS